MVSYASSKLQQPRTCGEGQIASAGSDAGRVRCLLRGCRLIRSPHRESRKAPQSRHDQVVQADWFARRARSGHPAASGAKIFVTQAWRAQPDFLSRFNKSTRRANHPKVCKAPCRKNILIFRNRKSVYIHRIPFHSEGRFANVTDVGMGCGGRSGARDGRCRCGR